MTDTAAATAASSTEHQGTVHRIVALASRGLAPMFDDRQQLFCYKLKKNGDKMVQEGISRRYTMMTLMGLHRLQQSGESSGFDTERILNSLFSNLDWVDNIGDFGVLLWLCGTACPERFAEVDRQFDIASALKRYRGAKNAVTMEIAWFLTGVSYWASAFPEKRTQLQQIAFDTYKLLTKNQGDRGFFGHQAQSGSFAGLLRGRVGSFADQVYPIYGMTQFAKAYGHEEASKRALKCAEGICKAQGPMGQWWWHYDAVHGTVTDGYPVFSVHQHAMAPMTLFALGEATGHDFNPHIYKGLDWIDANNELDFEMEDGAAGVIWRCIYRSRSSRMRYLKARFGRHSDALTHNGNRELKVLFECRPYELGWLLYAFAGRQEKTFLK